MLSPWFIYIEDLPIFGEKFTLYALSDKGGAEVHKAEKPITVKIGKGERREEKEKGERRKERARGERREESQR